MRRSRKSNDQRPSLLFVYPNQFGYHTDSYKYCSYLKNSFSISYLCYDQGYPKLSIQGVDIFYMPYQSFRIKRLIDFYLQVLKYTYRNPIDILFVIQFKFSFVLGLLGSSKIKILDFRSGDLSENKTLRYIKNKILWFDSLFYQHVTSISEGLTGILKLNQSKTIILPLGGESFSLKEHSFNRIDLLYVGSLERRNIDQTIKGLALFLSKNENYIGSVSYTIVGFGKVNTLKKINQLIKDLEIGDIVKFIGRVPYANLSVFFEKCNIGVAYIPKKPYYDFQPSTKTFEYILSGLFTIATDTFENQSIINGKNGILCNDTPESFADAIQWIHDNINVLGDYKIRDSIKDSKWESIVDKILRPFLLSLLQPEGPNSK